MKNFAQMFAVCVVLASDAALACSCQPQKLVDAFEESTDVVVARVISANQTPANGDTSGKYMTEDASFIVLEAIKGAKKVGDKVQVRSELGPGPCGRSARNTPAWLEQAPLRPSDESSPFPISDTWLIFGWGKEPYELSLCSRSSPMNVEGERSLSILRRLIEASGGQHEP